MNSKRLVLTFFTLLALVTTASIVDAQRDGWSNEVGTEGRDKDDDRDRDKDRDRDGDRDEDENNFLLRYDKRVLQGLEISPVRLDVRKKQRGLVGLGSYLVNAAGVCAECHTCPTFEPGQNPYQGGSGRINSRNFLAGGVPFGPFVSANITPDASGKPAGLTQSEFIQVIRTGRHPGAPAGSPPLQVMPWPVYRNLTNQDLRAIYAYLKAIPHAEPGTCSGGGD